MGVILDLVRRELGSSGDYIVAADRLIERRAEFLIPARADHGDLQAEALDRWSHAFDLLDLQRLVCEELMDEHDAATWDVRQEGTQGPVALHHLFWSGYVAACEVLALFRTGFSAGALARWRALHETTTRAELISQAGHALDATAEKYLDHEDFRHRAELRLFRGWLRASGAEQLVTREMTRFFARLDQELVERHRSAFRGEYGWAHQLLLDTDEEYARLVEERQRARGPTFADLERHVRGDHDDPRWWELLYSEASSAVHGAPRAAAAFDEGSIRALRGPDLGALAISPIGEATARRLNMLAWACMVPDDGEPDESDDTETLMQMLEATGALCGQTETAFRGVAFGDAKRFDAE